MVAPAAPDIEEAVSNFLFELGSRGCQQLEHAVVGFFPPECDAAEVERRLAFYFSELRALGMIVPPPNFEVMAVESLDWNVIWKRHFKPIFVRKKLVIKPSWEPLPPTSAVVIEIDPKQAFGTGSHATTLMALEFLADAVVAGRTVLDVGTGSGVLAIAAVKLGAARVSAVDVDSVAIEAAQENIQKNAVASEIQLIIGETTAIQPPGTFDLIAANLNRREVMRLIPEFRRLLKLGGSLFVTGILLEETEQVSSEFFKAGFSIQRKVEKEEWLGLIIKRGPEK